MGLGCLDALLTRLVFRFVLLRHVYTQAEFEGLVAQTKLRLVRIEGELGTEIWLQKCGGVRHRKFLYTST